MLAKMLHVPVNVLLHGNYPECWALSDADVQEMYAEIELEQPENQAPATLDGTLPPTMDAPPATA